MDHKLGTSPNRTQSPQLHGAPHAAESPFDISSFLAFSTTSSVAGGQVQANEETYSAFANGIRNMPTEGASATSSLAEHGGPLPQLHIPRRSRLMNSTSASSLGPSVSETDFNTSAGNNNISSAQPRNTSHAGDASSDKNSGELDRSDSLSHQRTSNSRPVSHHGLTSSDAGDDKTTSTQQGNSDIQSIGSYGLDPSAFHSEVRFQLPSFLDPSSARPAYPNGAEAWSGFGNMSAKSLEQVYPVTHIPTGLTPMEENQWKALNPSSAPTVPGALPLNMYDSKTSTIDPSQWSQWNSQ